MSCNEKIAFQDYINNKLSMTGIASMMDYL